MSLFENKSQKLAEGLQFDPVELEQVPVKEKENVLKALKWEGEGFDTRVHIVEPHSGQLIKYQPYRRTVSSAEGTVYYRKDDSGIERRYTESGKLMDQPVAPPIIAPKEQSDKKFSKP